MKFSFDYNVCQTFTPLSMVCCLCILWLHISKLLRQTILDLFFSPFSPIFCSKFINYWMIYDEYLFQDIWSTIAENGDIKYCFCVWEVNQCKCLETWNFKQSTSRNTSNAAELFTFQIENLTPSSPIATTFIEISCADLHCPCCFAKKSSSFIRNDADGAYAASATIQNSFYDMNYANAEP